MIDFLYNIFIFPLVQIIEISFAIANRLLKNNALAIIGVSAVVTVCTMPLYFIAEKWQQIERDIYKRLKPNVDKIKAVFKGDERYMILATYYRQNHYHPIYSLRSSLGLLIQIPFFISAYSYLSHLESIKGISFLFIKNLGAPDGALELGGISLNILPILMTLINCVSGAVYTRGLQTRDKVQVYGIALVFLVLLYNSPAGLVLYWTMNNIFSLAKNILSRMKHWKMIVYCVFCLFALYIIIRYIRIGFTPNRLFATGAFSLIFFIPLFIKLFRFIQNRISKVIVLEQSSISTHSAYILSALILFILCGIAIPGSLIASSVQDFSFLDSYTTPLPFLGTVFVQAMGIFLFWPLCVYFLFSLRIKYGLSLVLSLLCIMALSNTFLFPLNYGDITTTFRFSDPDVQTKFGSVISNGLITLGILGLFTYLLLSKHRFIFHSFQIIAIAALIVFSTINTFKINNEFKQYELIIKGSYSDISQDDKLKPIYNLSRNGKNVIVFMLDSAVSGYVPYIFEEKPELLRYFSGFTYYPNCTSFGQHTRTGMPPVFGGYEYQPKNIQKTRSYAMEKHNEALLLMPRIFLNENYRITLTDPTLANYGIKPDLSIFSLYPEISVLNTIGNYTAHWLRSHPELELVSVSKTLQELLIRFSFLKTAPPLFRIFIYDGANWLKSGGTGDQLSLTTMDSYTNLDYLTLLTEISDDYTNTYTAIINDLPHDPALFQVPDYVPAINVTDMGDGLFVNERVYHANMASFLLLGKWLKFLQEEGVYDNTRIIFVSDHGRMSSDYKGNMRLPNGEWLSRYHPLLLVKDFNSRGDMITDTTFMTNGDVPLIAMDGLIDNPQNPFSGEIIQKDKKNGIVIATSSSLRFVITNDQWIYVRDNIFDIDNWRKTEISH